MKPDIKKHLYDVNVSINSKFEYLGDKRDFTEYLKTNFCAGL